MYLLFLLIPTVVGASQRDTNPLPSDELATTIQMPIWNSSPLISNSMRYLLSVPNGILAIPMNKLSLIGCVVRMCVIIVTIMCCIAE